MNTRHFLRYAFPALLAASTQPALAHVDYADLSNPFSSPGGVNGAVFSNHGWHDGTTATLGDSHDLAAGVFFRFDLTQASLVSITFSDSNSSGLLNPAFSLYAGVFANEAHDDTTIDPLNPSHLVLTPTPHTVKDPSPVDNGVTTDAFGRISPFRDTANITYVGQFNALGSWSMSNESDEWAVVEYITHVAPTGGNSVSLLNYLLQPGSYTIAAAGGTPNNPVTNLSGIPGTVTFSSTAAPVPVPAALWLFASAMGGLAACRRRKP